MKPPVVLLDQLLPFLGGESVLFVQTAIINSAHCRIHSQDPGWPP